MGDASLLGGIRAGLAYGNLISPVRGVDESDPRAVEECLEQRLEIRSCQVTFDQLDVRQRGKFLSDQAFLGLHLSPDMPTDGAGNADEGSALPASRVDCCDDFPGHYNILIGKDSQRSRNAGSKFPVKISFRLGSRSAIRPGFGRLGSAGVGMLDGMLVKCSGPPLE